ncbi:hypothetical protein AX16_000271 [Volvariella volvacea WC 439]|nr:hypothetical protein AX16_000271 [Volvariella volvacea WC 439]
MDSSPTDLYLPSSFPFPIKIASIDAPASSQVERGTRLLTYSFRYKSSASGSQPETRFGTWDSAIEGTIDAWNVKPGDVISRRSAQEQPVLTAIEPCKHGMQLGGLCVLCGKDMTNMDYTGPSDAARASIQMTHSAFGPTVSLEVAQQIEQETAEHLFKSRKLSLIVDLDQTIVHATVDSTVGDWIAEGEAWEARQAERAARTTKNDDDDDSDDDESSSDSEDECNPNWEALKDVKKFKLDPESLVSPSMRGFSKAKGKAKLIESEGCIYYIKPRPGWKEFLQEMAKKYEMHVYTMGTRAYAEEVCAAIDPDGKIFGGRLLSRDESGSLTQKSLQRLFPCDTSMVVIIDDRADVWEWSPNLIKVIPYEFFVGIGDINSSFLPKVDPITGPIHSQPPAEAKDPPDLNGSAPASGSDSPSPTLVGSPTPSQPLDSSETEEDALEAKVTENVLALEAQLEERPLAKMQEALEAEEANAENNEGSTVPGAASATSPKFELSGSSPAPAKSVRKPLLKNDDYELERVGKLLDEVHERFFTLYDQHAKAYKASKRLNKKDAYPFDVTQIIPQIRANVLSGVHVLFSSVIPLDIKPESTEIWRVAHMFGAKCYTELTNEITHVVAAKRGTVKVDAARKRGGIKIVWLAWFNDSIALWARQDETPYLLDEPPTITPAPSSSSSAAPPEPNAEEENDEADVDDSLVEAPTLDLGDINWNDINDEVEAAMNESDDDDTRSERSVTRSANISEDEWISEDTSRTHSLNGTPRGSRKRLRSVTPSESLNNAEEDTLRSPLAKRKKLALSRSGSSRLKDSISANDLHESSEVYGLGLDEKESDYDPVLAKARVASWSTGARDDDMEDTGDESGDEFDDEDFLAGELEEEWG